jgi:predicted DNA-binding WGR domain protein
MFLEYRNDRRGYAMWLERDLFGAFVLYRRWYGLHNRRGGMKRQVFESEQDAMKEVRRVMRVRVRRGYAPVSQ